jgi:hypothetical protein
MPAMALVMRSCNVAEVLGDGEGNECSAMNVVWSSRAVRHLIEIREFIEKDSEQSAAVMAGPADWNLGTRDFGNAVYRSLSRQARTAGVACGIRWTSAVVTVAMICET